MEEFVAKHEYQLYAMGFPQELIQPLYEKLLHEILDAGTFFTIQQRVNESNEFISQEAVSVFDLLAGANVFLIDHAWTTRLVSIRETLSQNYKLLNRLNSLIKLRGEKIKIDCEEEPSKVFEDYCMDFDEQGLTEVPQIMEGIQGLSLWGNNFENISQIEGVLTGLKAIWLNDNPISNDMDSLLTYFEENYPGVEILNSKFTKHAGTWALQYASNCMDLSKVIEIDLSDRDLSRADPSILFQLSSLKTIDISANQISKALEQVLFKLPLLAKVKVDQRLEDWVWRNCQYFAGLKYINDFDTSKGKPDLVDIVISKIWGYVNTYRLSTEDTYDESSIWYILDEFGSSILHSDIPNCKLMPFLYSQGNAQPITYSLLWPVRHLRKGEIIYRDFLPLVTETDFRSYRLFPWVAIPQTQAISAFHKWESSLSTTPPHLSEISSIISTTPPPLKIATDLEFFASSLSDARFVLTTAEEADIIWTRGKIFDLNHFKTEKFLNQFPYETSIVMKNLLAQTIQKNGLVKWFPLTFDLNHELPALMGEFFTRQSQGLDNHWIIKPINMSRGIDCHITNSLDCIIRLMETGPKVVQKYIEKPFLLNNKKVDLRYIVLLHSASPLILTIYNHFWVRSANNDYDLSYSQHYSYETHFTVMNYSANEMKQIHDYEFIQSFEETTKTGWPATQEKIYKAIKELFTIATKVADMQREKSRAIYGIDIMLNDQLDPFILEVNFCPDCERAIKYYPDFTNQVFNNLFYGETEGVTLI